MINHKKRETMRTIIKARIHYNVDISTLRGTPIDSDFICTHSYYVVGIDKEIVHNMQAWQPQSVGEITKSSFFILQS
jgi:hypothetical protein